MDEAVHTGCELRIKRQGGVEVGQRVGVVSVDPSLGEDDIRCPRPYSRLDHPNKSLKDGFVAGKGGQRNIDAGPLASSRPVSSISPVPGNKYRPDS